MKTDEIKEGMTVQVDEGHMFLGRAEGVVTKVLAERTVPMAMVKVTRFRDRAKVGQEVLVAIAWLYNIGG